MIAAFQHLLVAFVPLLLGACAEPTPPEAHILIFTKTTGYRHTSIAAGKAALLTICREKNWQADTTEDAGFFTREKLARYRAVVFLNTTGDVLDSVQQSAFEGYIRNGGGFLGIHAASDTEYGWPWYGRLVGGWFRSHPEIQDAVIQVKDHDHAATRHLGATWQRRDEWYNLNLVNPDVNVLLLLDESSYRGGDMGPYHPLAWYHRFEGGRAFYTAGGHTEEAYSEPDFLRHLRGGLEYAAGK